MKAKSTRGAATRQRIVEAAAKLMQTNGVNGTSVDDVLSASGTGKSQFYHYFVSKDALVRELVAHHLAALPSVQDEALDAVAEPDGLAAWLDGFAADWRAGLYEAGCPIGNLASELSAQNEDVRLQLQDVFARWEGRLRAGFEKLQADGALGAGLDPATLAPFVVSALQGALLLAKAQRSIAPLTATIAMLKRTLVAAKAAEEPLPRTQEAAPPKPAAPAAAGAASASRRPVTPPKRPPLTFCP